VPSPPATTATVPPAPDPSRPALPVEPPPAEEPPDPLLVKIERELLKPEGQESFKDWSKREVDLYRQMRRDRKLRQRAEEERDVALLAQLKLKQAAEAPPVKDPLEALKQRDKADFLTVGEVVALLEKAPPSPAPVASAPVVADPVQRRFLTLCDQEARTLHPTDYDTVMTLMPDVIGKNPTYLRRLQDALVAGENPALTAYTLILSDPEFATLRPLAQARVAALRPVAPPVVPATEPPPSVPPTPASAAATRAQAQLEINAGKPQTTGSVGSGEDTPSEEMTLEELVAMPDAEFARLPRALRAKVLKQHGGGAVSLSTA